MLIHLNTFVLCSVFLQNLSIMANTNPNTKSKVYIVHEIGQEPELEIRMNSKYDFNDDIFRRYYGPYKIIVERIKCNLKENKDFKKDNENENEYHENKVIRRIRIFPHVTHKLDHLWNPKKAHQERAKWDVLVRCYNRRWTNVGSHKGKFEVEMYKRKDLGTRYLFYNVYDEEIQWFHMN